MKKILVDSNIFQISPQQIIESLDKNNGKLIVHGLLQRADTENQNGRIYPYKILKEQINKYIENFVNQNMATGQLDHSDKSTIDLKNVSHKIIEIE